MKKLKSRLGITMAEMLIVVAIIVILGGVSFVAVWNYQRSLGQLERDGIAKEIFVAAQNHLTAAYGEGYLGLDIAKAVEYTGNPFGEKADDGTYYFFVNGTIEEGTILSQMLPFGSVDDTVRIGGSYMIRYQPETGLVLDVFYCSTSGSPAEYNHNLGSIDNEYTTVMGLKGDANRNQRRTYTGGGSLKAILGWYGAEEAGNLPQITLRPPAIKIVNAEKLYVEVTNPNAGKEEAKLKLIVIGADSQAKKAYELKIGTTDERLKWNNSANTYSVILDDITTDDMHFADITADTTENFIPGEDLEIQAVAYSNTALANIAYSAKGTTNSLFGSIDSGQTTAYIGNIRHLENLDAAISNLDANDSGNKLNIAAAEQTDSFGWTDFRKNNKKIETKVKGETESDSGYETVRVYDFNRTPTAEGCYLPVEPEYALTYDGKNHSISDVVVSNADAEAAGLFGEISTVSAIQNLELIDFTVEGSATAGTLAGTISNCTVTNVLARNSTNAPAVNVSAPTAGGLIGSMTSGTTEYSAAAVIVGGSATAGGLIGSAQGTVTGCFSGGHTTNGSYEEWVKVDGHAYDVTGATAGGLIGSSSAEITDSYSTCSVSGSSAEGGFLGKVTAAGKITNCYAAGLVDPTQTTSAKYAFLGDGTPVTFDDNWYHSAVNQVPKTDGEEGETEPMLPYSGYVLNAANMDIIKPLDLNADAYNSFTGVFDDWDPARAYDPALVQYYSGKYSLRSVQDLNEELPDGYSWDDFFITTHYGDWPSPEVFFINTH